MRERLALRLNRHVFYGWVMLAVAGIGYFASGPGQSHTIGVFTTPISEDLGMSRTAVSSAYAVATLIAAFGLPYLGKLIDRFGMRLVITLVAAHFGLAVLAFGQITGIVTLTLGFMALRFLGQGSLMIGCTNLAAQWFEKRRGFALSLTSFGFLLSVAVHPPLAQWLTDQVGWREAWIWLALLTWVLLLPPLVLLVHNRPEDLGLEPDGPDSAAVSGSRSEAGPEEGLKSRRAADTGFTASEAIRTRAFWVIAGALATLSMLLTALFFHQVSIFESQGLAAQTATLVFSITAISAAITAPVLGHLLDRFDVRRLFAGGVLVTSLAMIAMTLVRDPLSAALYAVVLGVANAVIHAHAAFLWPHYFGRRHLGSIQGTGQAVGVVGASIGPIPFGAAFDLFGSYTGALLVFALQPVIFAILILFMKPPALDR